MHSNVARFLVRSTHKNVVGQRTYHASPQTAFWPLTGSINGARCKLQVQVHDPLAPGMKLDSLVPSGNMCCNTFRTLGRMPWPPLQCNSNSICLHRNLIRSVSSAPRLTKGCTRKGFARPQPLAGGFTKLSLCLLFKGKGAKAGVYKHTLGEFTHLGGVEIH